MNIQQQILGNLTLQIATYNDMLAYARAMVNPADRIKYLDMVTERIEGTQREIEKIKYSSFK